MLTLNCEERGRAMASKKRDHGAGTIRQRGENSWQLRYRIGNDRFTKTVKGTKADAVKKLRELLNAGDKGEHVVPDKMTVSAWIDHWIAIGAPGRRKKKVGRRTLEDYAQKLRTHVKPVLGDHALQKLQTIDVDKLYAGFESKTSATTARNVHVIFKACLSAAVRAKLLARNPVDDVEVVPTAGTFDHDVLDDAELARLVAGFKESTLYPIVAVCAFTGARLREVIALRWEDVDLENRIITVSRAVEDVKGYRGVKAPKTERGIRTFKIDAPLAGLLAAHREKQQRLIAGIPDNAEVDLSLIRLPAGTLLFPGGKGTDLTTLRCGRAVSRMFKHRIVKLGFPATLRLHDLRGSHETVLLDNGMNPKVVSERCGHDVATMLKAYAKRTKKADAAAADIIGAVSARALGPK
jgi:integrase